MSETEDQSITRHRTLASKTTTKILLYSFLALLFGLDWFLLSKFDFSTFVVAGFVTLLAGMIVFIALEAPWIIKSGIIFAWVVFLIANIVPRLSNFGADFKLQRASSLCEEQRFQEAYDLLSPIGDPSAQILCVKASCEFELGKYDEVIRDCEQAIKKNANNRLAYYLKGSTYYAQNKFDKAAVELYKAVQIPSSEIPLPLVKYRLGKSLINNGQFEEGNRYLREARVGGVKAEPH